MPDWNTAYVVDMPPDAAKAFYKFRGRSLDNLKRIYAVILSLAVGRFLEHIYGNIRWLSGVHAPGTNATDWTAAHDLWLQLLMFAIAITTVSVFFFQEDKLLDIAFGMDPNDETAINGTPSGKMMHVQRWIPYSFAVNYIVTLLILVPFAFLTFSANPIVVRAVGMKDFVISYLFLLVSGTLLASINVLILRNHLATEQAKTRARHLTMNWRIVNSTIAIVLEAILLFYKPRLGYPSPDPDANWWTDPLCFGAVFLLLASARNWFDFRGTWPMLVLNEVTDDKFGESHDFSRASLTHKFAKWADTAREFHDGREGRSAKRRITWVNAFSRLWLLVAAAGIVVIFLGGRS